MKGLIIVYTGNGKGKTSASLGAAIRMLGCGKPVGLVHFMKGAYESSEQVFFEELNLDIEVIAAGEGFFRNEKQRERQQQLAKEGLKKVEDMLDSKRFALVILDEINYVLDYGFLDVDEVIRIIRKRNTGQHFHTFMHSAHFNMIFL